MNRQADVARSLYLELRTLRLEVRVEVDIRELAACWTTASLWMIPTRCP